MDEEKIMNLWRWFYANEQMIRESIDKKMRNEQEIIVQNLDNLVLDLGMFSWDIGVGENKPWFFTISPNGDKDLLEKTKVIIENAPELANWEFNYCKPAKKWNRKLSIYDQNMDVQEIDASDWSYTAINEEDGLLMLLVEAPNIAYLDEETCLKAAELVILNEIGEEAKINRISSIIVSVKLADKYSSVKFRIDQLNKKIDV